MSERSEVYTEQEHELYQQANRDDGEMSAPEWRKADILDGRPIKGAGETTCAGTTTRVSTKNPILEFRLVFFSGVWNH